MIHLKFKVVLVLTVASACAPPVDETLISYFGAGETEMAKAREAVDVCMRTALPGAWDTRETMIRNAGYVDATFANPDRDIDDLKGMVLIHPSTETVVHLGADGGRGGCIVGLKGMSPQQSYELALPLVEHFDAVSNTELGQGLTPNAIEARRFWGPGYPIFIAAYKTWDILEEPGAAVRLSR